MKKVLFLLLLNYAVNLSASHIVRSGLRCEFIDSNAVSKRFLLTIELTRECAPNAIVFPYRMDAGIYTQSDAKLFAVHELPMLYKQIVSSCNGVCRELAVYQKLVVLPNAADGYHICGLICCRSFSTNVLQDQDDKSYQGMMPYCSIKGSWVSSFPVWVLPADLYVKTSVADTISYRLTVPEGADSVRILLSRPLTGGTLNNNFPDMPDFFPAFSYLTYSSADYNATNPLGQGSDIRVDDNNNRLLIQGNLSGNFTVGFRILVYAGDKITAEYNTETMVHVSPSGLPSNVIDLSAASLYNAKIRLDWTACFRELKSYFVERSSGRPYNFKVLDSNGSSQQTYTDSGLVSNLMYDYRIKGISLTGDTLYSDTVQAVTWASSLDETLSASGHELLVYPVPTEEQCTVSLRGLYLLHVKLSDISGRTIQDIVLRESESELLLNLSGLVSGLYQLEVIGSDGRLYRSKLIRN